MRQRMMANCRKIIDECDQIILDVLWWNDNRTDEEPMDCEWDRVTKSKIQKVLAQLERA